MTTREPSEYLINAKTRLFVEEFKTENQPDFVPTREQLERLVLKWVFEKHPMLTVREITMLQREVEHHITTSQDRGTKLEVIK